MSNLAAAAARSGTADHLRLRDVRAAYHRQYLDAQAALAACASAGMEVGGSLRIVGSGVVGGLRQNAIENFVDIDITIVKMPPFNDR